MTLGPAERDVTALAVDVEAMRAWVASTAGTVRAVDLASGRVVTTWHLGAAATAVATRAGYVASGTADGVLCLRREDGALLQCTVAHHGQISGLAFDPAGGALASTGWDGDVAVWTVPALAVIARRRFSAPDGGALCVNDVAFAPDGRALALAHSAAPPVRSPAVAAAERRGDAYTRPDPAAVITLWTPGDDRAITLRGHGGPVIAVAWTGDGARLVSGSWDRTIRMWDVTTGGEIARSGRFAHIVRDVAVSADSVAAVAWTFGRDGPASVTFDLLY